MKLRSIIAIFFITLLSLSTLVEARSSSTSSRSSSSSSRSSSSSSSYSTSKPSTTTSTPSISSYSKSYSTSSTPSATKSSTTKSEPSIGYPYRQTNPAYTQPKNTATNTTTINNRTVIYSNGPGGNGSTFFDSMLGTMAGMAVYNMITDDKGQTISVEPYYVSGEMRIPVWSGKIVPKEILSTPPADDPADKQFDWKAFWIVVASVFSIGIIISLFTNS